MAAGRDAEAKVLEQIPKLDETAIKLMQNQGMKLTAIRDSPNSKEWIAAAERFATDMRGDMVPAGIFDQALASRNSIARPRLPPRAASADGHHVWAEQDLEGTPVVAASAGVLRAELRGRS